jgi:3-isopropylmalate dehydratase small subunit
MEFFMPEFREMVRDGLDVIVAGSAFGCGSSRDVAVNALLGAGVKCVIARSFSFIYARNQPNIGLLGITMKDDAFFAAAQQGSDISIDLTSNQICCGGRAWGFQLSEIEKQLISIGGLGEAFRRFGKQLFDVICRPSGRGLASSSTTVGDIESIKV